MSQIQIVKLRQGVQATKLTAPTLQNLFHEIDDFIQKIPEEERFNIFYTVPHCKDGELRIFEYQNCYAFDIDGIDTNRVEEYFKPICEKINLGWGEFNVIFSGNGLHVIIFTTKIINSDDEFNHLRDKYKQACATIEHRLHTLGLQGKVDSAIFDRARILRLPGTKNIKKDKTTQQEVTKQCYFLSKSIQFHDWDLDEIKIDSGESIDYKEFSRYNVPDIDYIEAECNFLKTCKENQAQVSEINWYKMLSVVSRLGNPFAALEKCHEYSSQYPGYSTSETETKAIQALEASGPRTCKNISETHQGCSLCPHFGKITSPICLQGESYIKTKRTGFRNVTQEGKRTSVAQDDLKKQFYLDYQCGVHKGSLYIWDGKKWDEAEKYSRKDVTLLRYYAEKMVFPSPKDAEKTEFVNKIMDDFRIALDKDFFDKNAKEVINLENGILDFRTNEVKLLPHNKEFGFKFVIPFSYDPSSTCPRFIQFLAEIFPNRQDIADLVSEFLGLCLSGQDNNKWSMAPIFVGDGSNGKSVLADVFAAVIGKDAVSNVSMRDFDSKTEIFKMVQKLVNITDEAPRRLGDSANFKAIVTGGAVSVRRLYHVEESITPRVKLIALCNSVPSFNEVDDGLRRRLCIIPFDATFKGPNKDIFLKEKLLKEIPGIFNYLINCYMRLKKRGDFIVPEDLQLLTKEHIEGNDFMFSFIDEYVNITDNMDDKVTLEDLHAEWKTYVKQNELKDFCITKHSFATKLGMRMRSKCPDWNSRSFRETKREGKNIVNTRYYKGVSLTPKQF